MSQIRNIYLENNNDNNEIKLQETNNEWHKINITCGTPQEPRRIKHRAIINGISIKRYTLLSPNY